MSNFDELHINLGYSLNLIDTSSPEIITLELIRIFNLAFPNEDASDISRIVADVVRMFSGKYTGMQGNDAKYHDLEHTMQASVCFARLMLIRHYIGAPPVMGPEDFLRGMAAILLHDTGYLKEEGDMEGTGAKYTRIHEQRSGVYSSRYLSSIGWDVTTIASVYCMISCTGPFSDIEKVSFQKEIDRVMGKAICTADYLGQMSDPDYLNKLYYLYLEFEEADEFMKIPKNKRLFKSFKDLFDKTPDFWETVVQKRLMDECDNLCEYLSFPYLGGPNPYINAVKKNITQASRMIRNNELPVRRF